MSMPKFPHEKITTEQALNLILASIAMEEAGLSHIINAEGEKLQYILGTLHCGQRPCVKNEDILKVNDSIKRLLDTVMQNQIILKSKMEGALAALEKIKKKPCGGNGCNCGSGCNACNCGNGCNSCNCGSGCSATGCNGCNKCKSCGCFCCFDDCRGRNPCG